MGNTGSSRGKMEDVAETLRSNCGHKSQGGLARKDTCRDTWVKWAEHMHMGRQQQGRVASAHAQRCRKHYWEPREPRVQGDTGWCWSTDIMRSQPDCIPRHHLGRGKAMKKKPKRLCIYLKDWITPVRLLKTEKTKILLIVMKYYLAIKKNEELINIATWITLKPLC